MFTLKHLSAAALGTMLVASAFADTNVASDKAKKSAPQPAAAQSAMRAYIDPETGKLVDRPVTQEQKRAAAQTAPAQDASKVTMTQHANGMREYEFNGQADETMIATVRPDGSIEYRCAEHGIALGTPHDQATEARNDR